jgi:hypothetical protein
MKNFLPWGPELTRDCDRQIESFGLFLSRRSLVSKRLIDFLIDVSVNAKTRDEFTRDPETVLARTELSKAEKDAMLSGDPERIRVAAALSAAAGSN